MERNQTMTTESTDLHLSAALVALGHELIRIDRHAGRAAFVFTTNDKLAADVAAFYLSQLRVDPRAFGDALRSLKNALHVGNGNGGAR